MGRGGLKRRGDTEKGSNWGDKAATEDSTSPNLIVSLVVSFIGGGSTEKYDKVDDEGALAGRRGSLQS